jgi:uncharacterized protein (UPF0335 family)
MAGRRKSAKPATKHRKTAAVVTLRGSNADPDLERFAGRLVNLMKEQRSLAEDMASIYTDAKDKGYDVKVLRRTVKVLCETGEQRSERLRVEDASDDMLLRLGHLADTPLGRAAVAAYEGDPPEPMSSLAAAPVESDRPAPDFD